MRLPILFNEQAGADSGCPINRSTPGILRERNPLQNDGGRLQNITVSGLGPEVT